MTDRILTALPRRGFILVSATTLLSACVAAPGGRGSSANARDETAAALPMVNDLRRTRGLASLSVNAAAGAAAAHQAARMAKAQQMAHLIGLGDNFSSRMKDGKVPLPAAENVASGQETVERAVRAWIDSPKHLENMLGGYQGLGVAVARDTASGNRAYWAMVLCA